MRALGAHGPQMRHLDLYDRRMDDAAGVLAAACRGWPRLAYLCAAVVQDAWTDTLAYRAVAQSEKDAKLAPTLSQLQHCIAVFPQKCMGQLASFGPT